MKEIQEHGIHGFVKLCCEKYGSYFGCYLGNQPLLIICDPDMIHEIAITKFSKFNSRSDTPSAIKMWQNSISNAEGPSWKYLRSVMQPAFSSSKVKAMSPIICKSLDDLMTSLDETNGQEVDMYERYASLTMDVICATTFGITVNSQRNEDDPFVRHASKVLGVGLTNVRLILNFIFPTPFIRNITMAVAGDWTDKAAIDFLTKTVKKSIEARLKDSPVEYHDLLELMMATQNANSNPGVSVNKTFEQMKNDGMSEEDIVINGIVSLAAGYETTAALLAWMTCNLALHQEYQDRLYHEITETFGKTEIEVTYDKLMGMEFLDMFLQETLRLFPPVARFNRRSNCDVEIKGLKMRKGDVPYAIHRNPLYWEDPNTFNPERFTPENKHKIVPCSFIPFGVGPRNCVGMKLALLESKMVIVHLLQRMRVLKSPKFQVPPKVRLQGIILKPDAEMLVKLERR